MVLGQKFFEGKGKSAGPSFIKEISMEGIVSMYSYQAQLKGLGRAEGIQANLNVTAKSMTPPKGVAAAKDKGILMTVTGEMCVMRGLDLMKMVPGAKP